MREKSRKVLGPGDQGEPKVCETHGVRDCASCAWRPGQPASSGVGKERKIKRRENA